MVTCKILDGFFTETLLAGSMVLGTESPGAEEAFEPDEMAVRGFLGCESIIVASDVFDGAMA